ncbi:MAG TPA: MASE1 domain-containing protein [Candidatus Limnocylindria bacterium]|nr:MASE1 domain-containing protein [Candidatus Limnocylindria bacterium]
MVALAAVYFAAAKLGLSFAFTVPQVSPVWPSTGLAIAALVLGGRRLWPGVAAGAFAANWTTHEPALTALAIAAGNTLEALLAVTLLRRTSFRAALDRLRDVLALIAAAAFAPVVSATVGVTSLCLGGVHPWAAFAPLWSLWWIGDAVGALVTAPLVLTWLAPRPAGPLPAERLAESGALLGTLVVVSVTAFMSAPGLAGRGYPLHYAVFPLVVYAALRLGQRGASLAVFTTSAIAISGTVNGWGPLAAGTPTERVVVLLFFLSVVAATALLLAAATMERDAAERRRALGFERLEEGEQRLRLALEAGRMGVWDWDIATDRVRWSDNLPAIFGVDPADFPKQASGLLRFIHPDDRARVEHSVREALERGSFEFEFRTPGRDGKERRIATTGTMFRGADGRPARMLGVNMDVTGHRRLEAELTQRAADLAEADRRKDVFLAMLAHELRGPLAPISNALQVLRASPANADRALAIAERQMRQLVRLVDDLLDVSRITRGKITLVRERVALHEAVSRALETTRAPIDAARQRLAVSLPAEPIWLDADPARLEQILGNLLANAAKYTPEGGAIELAAERQDGQVVIRVRDTGPGVPDELRPRIFDLFVQGDTSLERTRGGLGVGLTIVRQLVELHGGTIEARTPESGSGGEFVVTLPVAEPPAAAASAETETRGAANGRRSVVIVEDNADAAESLACMLEIWGHRVRITADGQSALAEVESGAADVVLSDLGLPGMTGYELARRIRAHPRGQRVLLIAVSGYGQADDRARALAAGFDHHLVKPPDLSHLAELLTAARPGE